jgi:protein SCO1
MEDTPANTAPPKTPPSSLRQFIPLVWVGAASIATAIGLAVLLREPVQPALPQQCNIGVFDKIGGPIDLIDQTGASATPASFTEKPTLLYFGFASCPDICPQSLSKAAAALDMRPPGAPAIQTALISLDPARDTPATLSAYVASGGFPAGLKGLTGTQAQVDAAQKAFAVYGVRVEQPESALRYVIDHSSNFYLLDVKWKTIAVFPSTLAPADMATCIDRALTEAAGRQP